MKKKVVTKKVEEKLKPKGLEKEKVIQMGFELPSYRFPA